MIGEALYIKKHVEKIIERETDDISLTRCFLQQAILIDHTCIERVCPNQKYITTDLETFFFAFFILSSKSAVRFDKTAVFKCVHRARSIDQSIQWCSVE